jgi:predicted RNA-binding protein with PUA-like domain
MRRGAMAFWIFKCNPEKYRLEDRLADPNPTLTWTVSRHPDEIEPGDTVFLWVTGSHRGIRAVMRVDQAPRLLAELESEQPYWAERDTQEQWRVLGTLTHRFANLSHTILRSVPGLGDLSVFHGFQQMTNFPVTPEEGALLMRMIEGSRARERPTLNSPAPIAPRDDWERVLLGVATDCGTSLSDSAVSSEGIYE